MGITLDIACLEVFELHQVVILGVVTGTLIVVGALALYVTGEESLYAAFWWVGDAGLTTSPELHIKPLSDRCLFSTVPLHVASGWRSLAPVLTGPYFTDTAQEGSWGALMVRRNSSNVMPRPADVMIMDQSTDTDIQVTYLNPTPHFTLNLLRVKVRGVSLIISIGGMLITALLLGIGSDTIGDKVDDLKKGKASVVECEHTLIIG